MDLSAKDIARNLPSAEDVARALGFHTQRHSDVVPGIALFGAGLLVGAGLALLFAPTTGRELREELSERATNLRDRATAAADATAPRPA